MSTVRVRTLDIQQLGAQGSTTDQYFPILDEYEHSVLNLEFQNEFFEELKWGDSVADTARLDMIMNVRFGEHYHSFSYDSLDRARYLVWFAFDHQLSS